MSRVSFEEPTEERCRGLLEVRLSNPERLLSTEGSNGVPGYYDIEMLQRDLSVGEMDPDRTCLVAIDDNDTVVGYVDFRHTANYSQIGALEVLKAVQRMGIGRQLVEEVIDRCHGRTNSVSVAVDPLSPEAGFFARVGFRSGVQNSSDVAANLWERFI